MRCFTFLAVLLCMSSGTAAAGDIVASAAVASDVTPSAPVGGPVQFTWPIDQAADDLDERPAVHVAQSTGYAQTVTAAELRRGVALPIAQAGAFVKLSADGGVAVHAVHDAGRVVALRRVGAASDGAFILDPAAGVGAFVVKGEASGPVRVDVLERGSEVVLLASADSDVVLRGDDVVVRARLLSGGQAVTGRVVARLLAPDGRVVTRTLTRGDDGGYHGRLPALGAIGPTGRPWTVEFVADAKVSGRAVRRTTTTAVAVSVPTARLLGTGLALLSGEGLQAEFRLEVASAGRYAATALLYGRNREGQLQPIAVGQTADQLAPGGRTLALRFDAATISASGLRGPFELRDVRVVDQGRMFVVHRQARGLAATR